MTQIDSIYDKIGVKITELKPSEYLEGVTMPTMILIGENDELIKMPEIKKIFEGAPTHVKRLRIIKGEHSSERSKAIISQISKFCSMIFKLNSIERTGDYPPSGFSRPVSQLNYLQDRSSNPQIAPNHQNMRNSRDGLGGQNPFHSRNSGSNHGSGMDNSSMVLNLGRSPNQSYYGNRADPDSSLVFYPPNNATQRNNQEDVTTNAQHSAGRMTTNGDLSLHLGSRNKGQKDPRNTNLGKSMVFQNKRKTTNNYMKTSPLNHTFQINKDFGNYPSFFEDGAENYGSGGQYGGQNHAQINPFGVSTSPRNRNTPNSWQQTSPLQKPILGSGVGRRSKEGLSKRRRNLLNTPARVANLLKESGYRPSEFGNQSTISEIDNISLGFGDKEMLQESRRFNSSGMLQREEFRQYDQKKTRRGLDELRGRRTMSRSRRKRNGSAVIDSVYGERATTRRNRPPGSGAKKGMSTRRGKRRGSDFVPRLNTQRPRDVPERPMNLMQFGGRGGRERRQEPYQKGYGSAKKLSTPFEY